MRLSRTRQLWENLWENLWELWENLWESYGNQQQNSPLISLISHYSSTYVPLRIKKLPLYLVRIGGPGWSSSIAQDTTLGLLRANGFPESVIVAEGTSFPANPTRVAAVATDDVMLFLF